MNPVKVKYAINGILLLNKPQGLSSNGVLQRVKRLYQAKKAGHTGSLDPLATGMLPICFGEATKFCQYLLDADKTYIATGLLGAKTDTGDALGAIIATSSPFTISENELLQVMRQFLGESLQVPSMFSALKHKGAPLYKYARQGITIERPARPITIKQLQLLSFNGQQFEIKVTCSKGTYIRNLVEDIGECLGIGAYVLQLHRLYTGGYANQVMYNLEELTTMSEEQLSHCLLPMESAINDFAALTLTDEELNCLRQGKTLTALNNSGDTSLIRLYEKGGKFVGLGSFEQAGVLKVKRLLSEQEMNHR